MFSADFQLLMFSALMSAFTVSSVVIGLMAGTVAQELFS